MLSFRNAGAGNVLWVKASGELTHADHGEFLARLGGLVRKYGQARVLCELEEVRGRSAGSAWLDPRSPPVDPEAVSRFAIVGQEASRWWLMRMAEPFAIVRFFGPAEVEEARRWVTEGAQEDIDEELIRRLAYAKWEAAGRPAGDSSAFWTEAQRELFHVG